MTRQCPYRMSALSLAVGARLRELRQDAELTQAEVARRLNVARPIVTRTERGIHTLTVETLWAWCRVLELDPVTVLAPIDVDALVAIDFPPWQGPELPLAMQLERLARAERAVRAA